MASPASLSTTGLPPGSSARLRLLAVVLRLSAPARGRVEDRPSDRPTDRPSLSFKRRATHTRAHESRRERSHSRRLSCSRYIGQPRRLSRFLRAIHLHALLPPAPTYPLPLLLHLSLFLSSAALLLLGLGSSRSVSIIATGLGQMSRPPRCFPL